MLASMVLADQNGQEKKLIVIKTAPLNEIIKLLQGISTIIQKSEGLGYTCNALNSPHN